MGLAALRRILNPTPASLDDFRGHTVAVDADNLLWSFVTAMAARGDPPVGPDGRSIAHALGLVNRLALYAEHGMRSVWVFDGEQPALKTATLDARWARIEAARDAGDAVVGTALEDYQYVDAKAILSTLGIPWLVAPGESDAQCAFFARSGAAWAAVTQDYDAALHGSPLTGRNVSLSKTRKPELMDLEKGLAAAGLTREQLVDAAVLIGTDYNDGVKGVGPVKAVKLVKDQGSLAAALAKLGVDMPEAEEVKALFLDHPVDEAAKVIFASPDPARVLDVFERCGLSARRAGDASSAFTALHAAGSDD